MGRDQPVKNYVVVLLRGFALVLLVSCNSRLIATGHVSPAAFVGLLISWLWWSNSAKERPSGPGMGITYGAGAAIGTITGFYAAELISRWL